MKRWERWSFNSATAVVAVTGFMYFWMKYFVDSPDPFAVVNHPWQAAMLNLHVLASPVLILLFGLILNSHIVKKLGASRVPNRKSGLVSLALFVVMLASGYLLQIVTGRQTLQTLVALHVGSGAIFTVSYAVHLVLSWRLVRRAAAPARIREVA